MKANYQYMNSGIMFAKIQIEQHITHFDIEYCIYDLMLKEEKISKKNIENLLNTYLKQEGSNYIDHNPILLNYLDDDEVFNTVLSYSKKLYSNFYSDCEI